MADDETVNPGRWQIIDTRTWQRLYSTITVPRIPDTVVGFNVNLDRVIPVSHSLLDSVVFRDPNLGVLSSRLLASMPYYTAEEWFISDPYQYRHFTNAFAESGTVSVGGQAGIAALHLAGLGADRVVCAAPVHGTQTETILTRAGIHMPSLGSGTAAPADYIHLVFEYPSGIVPAAPGVTPRSNRFIVSPVHGPESVLISEMALDRFYRETASCSRAFFSGYQYLTTEAETLLAREQFRQMKEVNPHLKIHLESVTVTDDAVNRGFLSHLAPAVDSLGMNENELLILLRHLGIQPAASRNGILTPVQNLQGALLLCRNLGLDRLHLHTYGYYLLIVRKDAGEGESSRNALLYAAREVAYASRGTGMEISPEGIRAVEDVAGVLGEEISPGIFASDPYLAILVPSLIAANITKTTGLGDILSSTAFVTDIF